MSQYLDSLKIGDVVEFRGPSGLLTYAGKGNGPPPQLWCPRTSLECGSVCACTGVRPACPACGHSPGVRHRRLPQPHVPEASPASAQFSRPDSCGDG